MPEVGPDGGQSEAIRTEALEDREAIKRDGGPVTRPNSPRHHFEIEIRREAMQAAISLTDSGFMGRSTSTEDVLARAEKIAKFLLDGPEEKLNKSTSFEESLTEYAEYAKSSDPLIQWARDELRKIDEGPFTTIGYLRILEIISDMNHSGASLPRFLNVLCYLAQKHRLDPNHQIGV